MVALSRFLDPPRLRTATAERYDERHATWLELFVDLVFVVAIAELGTTFAHHTDFGGLLRYLGLFVPVWWAWAGFAFYATRFDTDDLVYRSLALLGMFCVAALATTVPIQTHVRRYDLAAANTALADLREGRIEGAAVLVP